MIAAFALAAALAVEPATEVALETLLGMEAAFAAVDDYEALLVKQEVPDGESRPWPEEQVRLRFRRPFAVRMEWVGKAHRGRRAVYVEGENGNRILAREGGIRGLVTVRLDPRGRLAMKGNRHPITDVGVGHLAATVAGELRRGLERGEVAFCAREDGPSRLRVAFEFAPGYYGARLDLAVSLAHGLPVAIEVFDARGRRLERYEYRDLRLDVGLGASDFVP